MLADKAILRVPRVVAPAERADQRRLSDDERVGEPAVVADYVALVYREGETSAVCRFSPRPSARRNASAPLPCCS